MANNWFPTWRKRSGNLDGAIIAPDERLPVGATLIMGLQHAVAMFGATVLMPLLMGFDANLAILMSGIGTPTVLPDCGWAGAQLSWLQRSICRSGHCRHWLYRQRP